MTTERTAEVVRADLREVQRQIMAFGSFVDRAEQLEDILAYFASVGERIDPSRLQEVFGDDTRAWQAAEDLRVIRGLLRDPELANRSESLRICLCGLFQCLWNRKCVLEQELAALEPPEPKAGLLERAAQIARESLALRLRNWV